LNQHARQSGDYGHGITTRPPPVCRTVISDLSVQVSIDSSRTMRRCVRMISCGPCAVGPCLDPASFRLMQQIVLLGASNLTYGFPLIVESLHATFGEVDLLAAHGHGRSYGRWNRVLGRGLPGIRTCGLWEQLAAAPCERPVLGLITDVGNDLLYGSEPATILGWVEECAQRLSQAGAAVTISGVPLESVKRMSAPRYHATRMCFFPGS